jgi:hypothetical protein
MSELFPPVRRVVTGEDAQGRAIFVEDAPSPAVKVVPARPGYRVTNVWRTGASPSGIHAPDSILDQQGVLPPTRGTVVRVIDYPPEPTNPEAVSYTHLRAHETG